MKRVIIYWLFMACAVFLQAQELSVAERNAQLGFNDTIDRQAEDFVEAYIVIADPGWQLYSVLGHCAFPTDKQKLWRILDEEVARGNQLDWGHHDLSAIHIRFVLHGLELAVCRV